MGFLDKLKGFKETIQKGLGDQDNPGPATSSSTEPTIQEQIDSLPDGDVLQLFPREFAGPVIVKRRLILEGTGAGATIWSLRGPVLVVDSDGVILRNVRVEVTGLNEVTQPEEACAILVKPGKGLHPENVEVRGNVIGLPKEEGEWRYPFSLQIGQLAYGQEHEFALRIYVPVSCSLISNISGFKLEPGKLSPGPNEIRLRLDRLPKDTLISGTISIVTPLLKRQVVVSAHILEGRSGHATPMKGTGQIIWEPGDWATLILPPEPEPPEVSVKSLVSPGQQPAPSIPIYPEPSTPLPPEATIAGSLEPASSPQESAVPPPESLPSAPVNTPAVAVAPPSSLTPSVSTPITDPVESAPGTPSPPEVQAQAPAPPSPGASLMISPEQSVSLPPETQAPDHVVETTAISAPLPPIEEVSSVTPPLDVSDTEIGTSLKPEPPREGAVPPSPTSPTASKAPSAGAISATPGSTPPATGVTKNLSSSPPPSSTPFPPLKRPATFRQQKPLDIGTDLWQAGMDEEQTDEVPSQEPHSGSKPSGVPKSRPLSKLFTTGSGESSAVSQDAPTPQKEEVKTISEDTPPISKTPLARDVVPDEEKKPVRENKAESPKSGKELKPTASPTNSKRKLVRQPGISKIFGGSPKEETTDEEK